MSVNTEKQASMKKFPYIRIIILISLFYSGSLFAQAPKYSNEFLNIGVGARAFGMSNTQSAIVNDVTAGYWNPAGLLQCEPDIQGALMHSDYFAGIAKYDYAAVSARFDENSRGAFSFLRFGVDDIPNTTELIDKDGNIDYDRIKTFSAADYAFIFSYARKMKAEGLQFGANAKIIHRKVGDFAKSWGFGLDAGFRYTINKWQFGLVGKDITSTFNAWTYSLNQETKDVFAATGNEIPKNSVEVTMPRIIMGSARGFDLSKDISLLAAVDLDFTTDGKRNVLIKSNLFSIDPHLGLEFGYRNIVFLRAGMGNIQQEVDNDGKNIKTFQPNIGLGIVIKKAISIDWALSDFGNMSIAPNSNVFSLKFNINKKIR